MNKKKTISDCIRILTTIGILSGGVYYTNQAKIKEENYRKDLITQIEEIEDRRGNNGGNGKLDYDEFANVYQVIDEATSRTINLSFDSMLPLRKLTASELETYLNNVGDYEKY